MICRLPIEYFAITQSQLPIVLRFFTEHEHGPIIAMFCVTFPNDYTAETVVMDERDFARFDIKMSFHITQNIIIQYINGGIMWCNAPWWYCSMISCSNTSSPRLSVQLTAIIFRTITVCHSAASFPIQRLGVCEGMSILMFTFIKLGHFYPLYCHS